MLYSHFCILWEKVSQILLFTSKNQLDLGGLISLEAVLMFQLLLYMDGFFCCCLFFFPEKVFLAKCLISLTVLHLSHRIGYLNYYQFIVSKLIVVDKRKHLICKAKSS